MISWITQLDVNILYYVQDNMRSEILNEVVKVFTSLGNYGLIWILFTLALLIYSDTRKVGMMCAVALIIDLILCNGILKNVIARTRPYDAFENIRCIISPQPDYSFPSGHTASSFAAVVPAIVNKNTRRIGVVALIIAILMAVSRIYVCVHYPSDVVGGLIIGMLCGAVSCKIFKKYMQNKEK